MKTLARLCLVSLLLAACVLPTYAENLGPGGGTRVIVGDQLVGPYRLWVTTSPEPAQVGKLTVAARVTDPNTNKKVTDAALDVELTNPDDSTKLKARLTHENAGNAIDYAAHIDVPSAGSWDTVLHVNGPAGPAEVRFTARVLSPRSSSTLVVIGLPFLAVLLLLGGVWYWRAGSRKTATASL